MSIIKHVTLQKIVAHDFRYDSHIMSVCKIMVPMFLKETNSVNLILTLLCRELTKEEKICGSSV